MNTKICKVCKVEKSCDSFHKMKKGLYGVRSSCKDCRKIEKQDYLSREYVKQKNKLYYQDHKNEIRERTNKHRWTLNGQYHEYKKSAKKRNLDFELTQSDCEQFYNKCCYYCGELYTGLGMDRVDNNIGYKLGNILSCCYTCNLMKRTLSVSNFFEHIKKILLHHDK